MFDNEDHRNFYFPFDSKDSFKPNARDFGGLELGRKGRS